MKRLIALLAAALILLSGCHRVTPDSTGEASAAPSLPAEAGSTLPSQTAPQEDTQQTQPTETLPAPSTTPPETQPPAFDAMAYAESMPLEELVGQLFLARCPGSATGAADAQRYHLGGYVLFGRDFEGQTPESLRETVASYQAASAVPMLLAVDEEGGTVTRVSSYSPFRAAKFPSPRSLYDSGGLALVLQTEAEKGALLHGLGLNVNLAPVCDITTDPAAFMYSRSLGRSPEQTGEFVAGAVATMAQEQVGCVLKHFPGYGNNTDTHTGIAVDNRPLESLEGNDLVPFRYGIQAGCGGIMVSHTIVTCLDSELPASLSPKVVAYLRNTMDFSGVIVTDDLAMQAISDQYGAGESAVMALQAGCDLLCCTYYAQQYEAVLEAAQNGRLPLSQLQTSAARILQWKYELGLLS